MIIPKITPGIVNVNKFSTQHRIEKNPHIQLTKKYEL